jgi:membrane protein YqaA with SNARE-associated domain
MLLALAWGFAEATVFFVIPDVLLSYVVILDWKSTWRHILAAIGGALLGGALLFHWSRVDPEMARSMVARVPFVTEEMFERADEGLKVHGLAGVFIGSVTGLPFKLYAVEAPKYFSSARFLLVTPPARFVRFFLVWAGFGATAAWLKKNYAVRTSRLTGIHAVFWIVSYAIYWGRIVYR